MVKCILGIDPGLSGAVSLFDITLKKPLELYDIPTITSQNSDKRTIDIPKLSIYISSMVKNYSILCACIEKVHAMPDQGVVSMFNFGMGYGILLGLLTANGLKIVEIAPSAWKAGLNLSSDKRESLALVKKLYPSHAESFKRIKDNGRAEALLIAHFAAKFIKE